METKLVQFDAPELQGIETSKAEQIKLTFEPMAKMLEEFEEAFNEVVLLSEKEITKEVTAKAKRLRLDIGKVRISTEKVRKEQKEEYLRAGKAIDGVSNILKWAITDKENKLQEIENYFEVQEQKRLEALQVERAEKLSLYVKDAHDRDLSKFADDEFEALLIMKKKEHEDRIEAERLAEIERIAKAKAEEEAREKQRLENERLKADAEKREKEIEAERKKQNEILEKQRAEAERLAKIEAEKQAKIKADLEAKIKSEQEAKAKLEAELKAKQEAEKLAKEQEEALKQAELNKGDEAKLIDLIADLTALKTKYTFNSEKNIQKYNDFCVLIDKLVLHIKK